MVENVTEQMSGHPRADLTVRLVGRLGVIRSGTVLEDRLIGTRKARVVLGVLAAHAPAVVGTDTLAEAVWGGDRPEKPSDNLATLVSRMRANLGDTVIAGDRTGWSLGPGATTDVLEAETLIDEARRRLAAGEPAVAIVTTNAALSGLGEGEVLLGVDSPWADRLRRHVRVLLRTARLTAGAARLTAGDPAGAAEAVDAAIAADPMDEEAVRLAMRAHAASGSPARGLAAYDRLRSVLSEELGVDPAPETRELHMALLREQTLPADDEVTPSSARYSRGTGVVRQGRGAFVGRGAELTDLSRYWRAALEGAGSLVLVVGEPGIGKTRLAAQLVDQARLSGGTVLEARCYDAERSLFLQPFVEAVRPEIVRTDPASVRALVGDHATTLAALVPDVGGVLGPAPRVQATPDTERRLAYQAIAELLVRMGARAPVLLVLDDAQHASASTLELLHLLARRVESAPVLILLTVRSEEGVDVVTALADVAARVDLGPLGEAAVLELAAAYGRAEDGPRVLARTRGHPLFVVESLRSLSAVDTGLPASLAATVDRQVASVGEEEAGLARAGSVLGATFDPFLLAPLVGEDPIATIRGCERLVSAHLLVRSGSAYSFTNDLTQEAVYAATPIPLRLALHRRAADLLVEQPEARAMHREAAGDRAEAADAWLSAGLQAAHRFAAADAEDLLTRGVRAAALTDDPALQALSRLERGRLRVNRARFADAREDFEAAVTLADEYDLLELQVLARRELAGDVLVGLGRPISACEPHLEAGLRAARRLGQVAGEVDLLARGAIIATNRLQFVRATADAARAVELARSIKDPTSLRLALDGHKTVHAYLGDLSALAATTAELEPLSRQGDNSMILQWSIFERSIVPLAAGDWAGAAALVEEALALCRRTGWPSFEPWFLSHLGWIARLDGRLDEAVEHGRRAVGLGSTMTHPWWNAISCSMLATSLLTIDVESTEAVRILRRGLSSADRAGVEAYRFRCLASLAEATGTADVRDQAQRLFDEMDLPSGRAWLHGADAMVSLARAWLAEDRPEAAIAVLENLNAVGSSTGWSAYLAASGVDSTLITARKRHERATTRSR